MVLTWTRLKDFLVERGLKEVSIPVYDPNRIKIESPRVVCGLARGLRKNGNNSKNTKEILPEHCLILEWVQAS